MRPDGGRHGRGGKALVDVLDATLTPMGARTLRRWIVMPLNELLSAEV